MSDRLLGLVVGAIKDKAEELAHASCMRPKADPFEHGQQVGLYQGLIFAISILEDTLNEADQREKNS